MNTKVQPISDLVTFDGSGGTKYALLEPGLYKSIGITALVTVGGATDGSKLSKGLKVEAYDNYGPVFECDANGTSKYTDQAEFMYPRTQVGKLLDEATVLDTEKKFLMHWAPGHLVPGGVFKIGKGGKLKFTMGAFVATFGAGALCTKLEIKVTGIRVGAGKACIMTDIIINAGAYKHFEGGRGTIKGFYYKDTTGDDITEFTIAERRGRSITLESIQIKEMQQHASEWREEAYDTAIYMGRVDIPDAMGRGILVRKTTANEDTRVLTAEAL